MTVRTRLFYARRELYAALSAEPALAPLLAAFVPPKERAAAPKARAAKVGAQPVGAHAEEGES